MKKLYLFLLILTVFNFLLPPQAFTQTCPGLTATYRTYESRCAATGAIKVIATGGSGTYKYKMQGPSTTNFTTTDSITGLAAGTYVLYINDIINNCTISVSNVVVAGTYQDPRFTLIKQDVTCDNGNNGSVTVDGQLFGRSPYSYSIVAPSPTGIGTTNSTGIFAGLSAGFYSIRMTDSCGGIQTRQITVGNYSWRIDTWSFTRTGCHEISGFIRVVDSKGNISTVGGIPGFMYGIVRTPGDTIWSSTPNFVFTLTATNSFDVLVKDNCGLIKKVRVTVQTQPITATTVNTFNYLCNKFSASLSASNFTNPQFCLYDVSDVLITCNTSGSFPDLEYGSYCIKVHDECTDTTITRCFTAVPPPIGINNSAVISNKTCSTFTATVIGQTGLTTPNYCLYNSNDSLIGCNGTGVFINLPYQPYCIKVHDGCRDTVLTVCFDPRPPVPSLPPVISPGYVTCTIFGVIVVGDSTTNPTYCLYDSNGVVIICNNTGIFDSIPVGNYCITMHDECTDTIIKRCFGVLGPEVTNDIKYLIRNKACSTFTAVVTSASLISPKYCLYNASDSLIDCNTTGVFGDLPYGDYCVKVRPSCPDTLLTMCFSAGAEIPSVAANVSLSQFTCTNFAMTIGSFNNISSPKFCLYDSADVEITCNNTGQFYNLPYGKYCLKIKDGCYDTTIIRCFSRYPANVDISGSAGRSCSLGFVKFNLNFGGGSLPVRIKISQPDGTTILDTLCNSSSVNIDNIPGLLPTETYLITAADNCGYTDSLRLGATGSYFNHNAYVVPKCPGASWANGSGDIKVNIGTNLGALTVRLIKKDGIAYSPSRSPDVVTGSVYTFSDLGPGLYIISSTENFCNKRFNDTITIFPYQFPNLTRSSAYQCDVNGFSVSAVATGGVSPFSYSIIGSLPSTPSIVAGPQVSPIFNINNGATYSLIRLRALDGCGNATLGDASILPLASNGIEATADCFSRPTLLSVDPIYNATYAWYKKTSASSTDSTFLTDESSYFIADVTLQDVGYYVCYMSVNSGCINRAYSFTLTGLCSIILPVKLLDFSGKTINNKNELSWKATGEINLSRYALERKDLQQDFHSIGTISTRGNNPGIKQYKFIDQSPAEGINIYRLKMINDNGSLSHSNQVVLSNRNSSLFSVYPNPVKEELTIRFGLSNNHRFNIILFNALNQPVHIVETSMDAGGNIHIARPPALLKGIYFIKITDTITGQLYTEKVIYL